MVVRSVSQANSVAATPIPTVTPNTMPKSVSDHEDNDNDDDDDDDEEDEEEEEEEEEG